MKQAGTNRIATKPAFEFIPSSNFSSRNGKTIKRIVLHYTTSNNINGVVSWFQDTKSNVSAHYVVGKNGRLIQMVRDSDKAWHCRGENADTIGIEICAESNEKLTDAQTFVLVDLLDYMCEEYHIPTTSITAHRFTESNIGHTDCPGNLWTDEQDLANWVQKHLAGQPKKLVTDVPKNVLLILGDKGPLIFELHKRLVELNKLGDGNHGDEFTKVTEAAVKWFQKTAFLVTDGKVGPKTWAALFPKDADKTLTNNSTATLTKSANDSPKNQLWDDAGLVSLDLKIGDQTFLVASGQGNKQFFRKATDKNSRAGSMEPIPQGRYKIADLEWANGTDNYTGSHGAGLGPVKTYLEPLQTMDRGAFYLHIDSNISEFAGSAGCPVIASVADAKLIVAALRKFDPTILVVNWGI